MQQLLLSFRLPRLITNRGRRPARSTLAAALLFLSTLPAAAATVYWDGGAGTTAWTDGLNWSNNVVPTAADDVILDNQFVSGSYNVVLTGLSRTARSLQVGYAGSANTITLTISGGGTGDNLKLGGATGYDLTIAQGGVLANQSTVSGSGSRGIEFLNVADSWQMTGNGTYIHSQNAGTFINVAAANVSFASTSTFEARSGLTSTWGGAGGGLSVIKTYGNLKINPSSGGTLNLRVTTDSLRVTGDLTVFNSLFKLQLSDNATQVRAHVLGNVVVTDAQLYVSAGASSSRLVIDGNVTSSGSAARVSAASPTGNPKGYMVIGGDLTAYYAGSSNNEALIFWKPGALNTSAFIPEAGSTFKTIDIYKKVALGEELNFTNASNILTIYSGGTLDCNGNNVTGSGKFDLQAGGSLKITNSSGITSGNQLAGNIQTTGSRTFDAGATYWYTSTGSQVTGDGLPSQVAGLVLSKNASANTVTLTNPVTVNSSLMLMKGRLALVNNDLTLASGATITGGSTDSFIQTASSSLATGELVQEVSNTNSDVFFPVGISTFTPVTLAQAPGAATDNFRVRVFEGAYSAGISGETFSFNVVNRTWMVEEATAGGSDVTLTLQWNTADEKPSFQRLNTRIRHYTGGAYDLAMPQSSALGADPYTMTRAGITSFSPFMVGDGSVVLPVELTTFRAKAESDGVHLNWATASERDNDHFEIQRATTANSDAFRTIGQVAGHGTTQQAQAYKWLDAAPPRTTAVYYRLRQVDGSGRSSFSEVVAVRPGNPVAELVLYPNPATDRLTVVLPALGADALVRVFDALGREVLHQLPTSEAGAWLLDLQRLAPGAYTLVLSDGTGLQQRQTFVRQ